MDRDDDWGRVSDDGPRDLVEGPLTSEMEEQPRARSRAGLVVAVAVLLIAGLASISYVSGGSGSNSPEDAVSALATAIGDEDLLGVLDALAPSERDILRDTVDDVTKELRRLDVVDDDIDLSGIDGVDIDVRDLRLSTRILGDGVALVTVNGNVVYGITPADLPSGGFLEDALDPAQADSESRTQPIEALELVTIEQGGGWYVSLFYSVADAARRDADLPAPAFGNGVEPDGEESPEAVIRALVDAGTSLDVERAIELIDPEEGRVLHDYAPLFLDDAKAAAAEARDEFEVDVHELDLRTDRDGNKGYVTVTRLKATVGTDDGDAEVEFDGTCATVRTRDGTESSCADEESVDERFGTALAPLSRLFDESGALRLATVERDGEWYLSPLRTLFDPIVESLRRVEKSDLEALGEFLFGFVGVAETGETIEESGMSDRGVQSTLRNAYVAFMVARTDTGSWPTDPRVVSEIEPSVIFFPYSSGSIPPGIVSFEVEGERVRLASRGMSGCFYMEGEAEGAVAYAEDPECGDPAAQSYGSSW